MAARSIGSGTLTLGLLGIPIRLYTATRAQSVSFNHLHKDCGARVKQQMICAAHDPPPVLERGDMVKAFEHARDQYVTFADEEIKALDASRSDLDLLEFVPEDTVDFVYIEKTYYLGPDKGGAKAYAVLATALRESSRCGVGRFANRGKDTLVIIRAYRDGLLLHEVYYANEVLSFDEVPKPDGTALRNEVDLAKVLIESLETPRFDAGRYRDEYALKVKSLVEQKIAGEQGYVAPDRPRAQVADLREALKRSVAELEKKAEAARAADSRPEPSTIKTKKGPTKATPRAGEKRRRRADAVS